MTVLDRHSLNIDTGGTSFLRGGGGGGLNPHCPSRAGTTPPACGGKTNQSDRLALSRAWFMEDLGLVPILDPVIPSPACGGKTPLPSKHPRGSDLGIRCNPPPAPSSNHGRLHRSLRDALTDHFAGQQAAYEAQRRDWRRDHPLQPGSVWTPESIGLDPREPRVAD